MLFLGVAWYKWQQTRTMFKKKNKGCTQELMFIANKQTKRESEGEREDGEERNV